MPKKTRCNLPDPAFATHLQTPQFRGAWNAWRTERKIRYPKERLTERMLTSQARRCAEAPGGHDHAVAMLVQAADRGWKMVQADWVPNPATAKAVKAATQAARPAWQLKQDLEQLRRDKTNAWRSDFESQAGRDKYSSQWAKVCALTSQIQALETAIAHATPPH